MRVSTNREALAMLMPQLLEESMWFEVHPLPWDFYAVEVLPENQHRLERILGKEQTWTVVVFDNHSNDHSLHVVQATVKEDAERHAVISHLDELVEEELWSEYLEQGYASAVYVFQGNLSPE